MDDQFFQRRRLLGPRSSLTASRRVVPPAPALDVLADSPGRFRPCGHSLPGAPSCVHPCGWPPSGSMQAWMAHPGQLDSSLPSAPSAWRAHPKVFSLPRHATGACLSRGDWSLAGLLSWGSSQRLPLHRLPTCVSSPSLLPSPSREVPSGLGMRHFQLSPSVPPRLRCEPSAPACQSGTRSALAVSHDVGGLLHTRSAGLLHPAADHGVRLVAGSWLGPASTPPAVSCLPEGLHDVPSGARLPLPRSEDRSALCRRPSCIVPKHAARGPGDQAALHCWSDGRGSNSAATGRVWSCRPAIGSRSGGRMAGCRLTGCAASRSPWPSAARATEAASFPRPLRRAP